MNARLLRRFSQLGILATAVVIAGCPSQNSVRPENYAELSVQSEPSVDEAVAAESVVSISAVTQTVSYEVCAEASDWQRPSEADQLKQISADPRYQAELEDEFLKNLSDRFWHHQAISFTTYGLSARMEPMTFSGLWTVEDELWNCYESEVTEQINAGETAETWLMNHRVADLQWQDNRYVMTVEPALTGVQVVQFSRVDDRQELALSVFTTDGQPVEVLSGDWE